MGEATVHIDEPTAVSEADQPWLDMDQQIADALTGAPDREILSLPEKEPEPVEIPETDQELPADEAEELATDELQEIAEESDPRQVDYDLAVPMPDDVTEEVTIGQLKDSYLGMARKERELDNRDLEIMSMRRELQGIIQTAGSNVTPEQRQQIAQIEQGQLQREYEAMLHMRPDWKEASNFEQAKKGMFTAARRYGFRDDELKAISDHRVIAMLDALSSYHKRFDDAAEAAKPVQKAAKQRTRRSRPRQRKGITEKHIKAVAKHGSQDQKHDAIAELLRSQ